MKRERKKKTAGVKVGDIQIGGGAPVAVQSMTNTATSDAGATAWQVVELARAGSELVRFTVDTPEAAKAVPEIRMRVRDAGVTVPLIGDFHYNGHEILRQFPECASSLDKYRINPGNVGAGAARDERFAAICRIAADHGVPVRIGVNGGSIDPGLLSSRMKANTAGRSSREIINECAVISAIESTERALRSGLTCSQIVLSCKVSDPVDLIAVYEELSRQTDQPLHLGLTEAGMGSKAIVFSAVPMAILLARGIGDTIRVSLTPAPTPEPWGDRTQEVIVAQEILQALGLRAFAPVVTACPGCGRTSGEDFQKMAARVQGHVRERIPEWRKKHPGVETMTIAVMGCIVNGPGESRAADIGICLPGSGEHPKAPVYAGGEKVATLEGSAEKLADDFCRLLDDYVRKKYGGAS